MTQTLTFFTPGTPRPQGSKRYIGGGRSIESSKHLPAWRKALTTSAETAHNHKPPIQGPITITAIFIFPRPKRLKNKTEPHTKTPDLDKLQRALGDALTQSGAINDDSQITTWITHKRYAHPGETPGAHIHLTQKETHMAHPYPHDDTNDDTLPDWERADQLERDHQEEQYEIQKDEQ